MDILLQNSHCLVYESSAELFCLLGHLCICDRHVQSTVTASFFQTRIFCNGTSDCCQSTRATSGLAAFDRRYCTRAQWLFVKPVSCQQMRTSIVDSSVDSRSGKPSEAHRWQFGSVSRKKKKKIDKRKNEIAPERVHWDRRDGKMSKWPSGSIVTRSNGIVFHTSRGERGERGARCYTV